MVKPLPSKRTATTVTAEKVSEITHHFQENLKTSISKDFNFPRKSKEPSMNACKNFKANEVLTSSHIWVRLDDIRTLLKPLKKIGKN